MSCVVARGSFVLEHGASMGEGQETVMRADIVAGSGTGELVGISGSGLVEHELLTRGRRCPAGAEAGRSRCCRSTLVG